MKILLLNYLGVLGVSRGQALLVASATELPPWLLIIMRRVFILLVQIVFLLHGLALNGILNPSLAMLAHWDILLIWILILDIL